MAPQPTARTTAEQPTAAKQTAATQASKSHVAVKGDYRAGDPAVSYRDEARPDFRTGDVLCFRGKGIGSWFIRMGTRSAYSHCGLVFRFEGRVFCLEAIGAAGVRLALMSTLMNHYKGGVDYFEVLGATDEDRHKALLFGFEQLGQVYDNRGIIRFAKAILFKKKESGLEDLDWFCSELVAAAYIDADFPLVDLQPYYTSPADLVKSARLRKVRTLKP